MTRNMVTHLISIFFLFLYLDFIEIFYFKCVLKPWSNCNLICDYEIIRLHKNLDYNFVCLNFIAMTRITNEQRFYDTDLQKRKYSRIRVTKKIVFKYYFFFGNSLDDLYHIFYTYNIHIPIYIMK